MGSELGTKEKKEEASNTSVVSNDLEDDMKQMQKDLAKVNLSLEGVNQQLKLMMGENTDSPSNVSLVNIMKLLENVAPKTKSEIGCRQKTISSFSSSSPV